MLKNLFIKNNIETAKIDLNNPVNIIIGEKGTGKSTLLQIIAEAIINKKMFGDEYNWIKDKANFELDTITIDNTKINAQDFGYFFDKENTKDKTFDLAMSELQKQLPGYISQNDKRKNALDSTEYVEERKLKALNYFSKKIAYSDLNSLDKFINLRNKVIEFNSLLDERLPLGTAIDFEVLKNSEGSTNNIILVNYDNNDIFSTISELLNVVSNYRDELKMAQLNCNSVLSEIKNGNNNFNNILINEELIKELERNTEDAIKINATLYKTYDKYFNTLSNYLSALRCFESVITNLQNKYKIEVRKTERVQIDKNDLLKFFSKVGSFAKDIKHKYQDIIENELEFDAELEEIDPHNSSISYKVKKFVISEDQKYMLLNKIVTASNKSSTVADVLLVTPKPQYDKEEVVKKLLKDQIKVYAGQVEYKNLSTGQKTLFGVTHAINSLKNVPNENYLLLDQIEDNLDNKTIYENILPLIKKQVEKGKQVFIVTHNANIGSIIKGNSIVTNIFADKLEDKFVINKFINNEDAKIVYLEGGSKAFDERKQIYDNDKKGVK